MNIFFGSGISINRNFGSQSKAAVATNPINRKQLPSKTIDLNKMPNYRYQLSFGATNIETFAKMRALTNQKNYKFQDLLKLFKELSLTAQKNVKGVVERLKKDGVTLEKYLPACAEQEKLFYQKPETVEERVNGFVEKFATGDVKRKNIVGACLSAPSLLTCDPETVEVNVNGLVEKFATGDVKRKDIVAACLNSPSLFYQNPETVDARVNSFVERFAGDGVTREAMVKACFKAPVLFCRDPESIESNINGLVKRFEEDGVTRESVMKACFKTPALFCRDPETVENNVNGLVEEFAGMGLTRGKTLETYLKMPALLGLSPATATEHIKVYMYADNNLTLEGALKKNFTYSTSLIYLKQIILPKLRIQCPEVKWKQDGLKGQIKKYFKAHPDKQVVVTAKEGEMKENFIKTIREYCKKDIGREDAILIIDKSAK